MNNDKMKFQTPDLTAENAAKLAELFPGAVVEGKVNIDLLRAMLGEDVFTDEAYEFTWVGKRAAIAEAGKPIRKTLRPAPVESRDWDATENLYIEGDNLDVLKLLQESYLGKVKMIYIDPPYNTGNDFIYHDNFTQSREEYDEDAGVYDEDGDRLYRNTESNGRFHSDWCSMIYPRLVLARNLLSSDGVIFISIDDNEVAQLRKICDEVFGAGNFVGQITWLKKTKPINSGSAKFQLQSKIEYILVYRKSKQDTDTYVFKLRQSGERQYNFKTDRGNCRLKDIEDSDSGTKARDTMKFPILGITPSIGRRWKIGFDEIQRLISEDKVQIIDGKVKILVYPNDEDSDILEPFWSHLDKVGTAENGKKELNALLETPIGFDTVKPVDLLKELLFHTTNSSDIILDFFSGSATTAHAVMQLNAEDGGKRKFIMVQFPEECNPDSEAAKAGYMTICEIGKERIRRAGDKIKDEAGLTAQNLDIGFRVLKLADTNMNDVYYAPGDYTQDMLLQMESNIKSDRTDMDLLFGCLLDWGLPLSMPHTHEDINGFTVHTYNGGDLIACFDEKISETAIRKIAGRKPLRAVFRDSGFTSSPEKINVFEIFKLLAPNTNVRVI